MGTGTPKRATKKAGDMSGYVVAGVLYFVTHPSLWLATIWPLLMMLVVSLTSIIVLFTLTLGPQARALADVKVLSQTATHAHTHTHTHTHTHARLHARTHTHTNTHARTHVHTHSLSHAPIHTGAVWACLVLGGYFRALRIPRGGARGIGGIHSQKYYLQCLHIYM